MTLEPKKTFNNPTDGNTYYLASLEDGNSKVLWACPTNRDGSADFVSAIPETDFAEPLTPDDRELIVRALT